MPKLPIVPAHARLRRWLVPLCCLMALAAGSWSAAEPTAQQIDAVFTDYDSTQVPGCALGIYRDGKTIYARGYGMANLEYGLAIAPDSVFRMASVSKQFVAAAIALLHEAGQLDLDDPVQKYFPDLPDYGAPVTVRQLIHHTSGIRDYLELAWMADWGEWFTTDEAVRVIQRQTALNFSPGTEFLYSNSGYLLLAELVKRVTGQTLREWAEENMFQPLGMKDSHFHDNHRHLVPRRADGYAPGQSGWEISMTQLDMVGDGGLFTTVQDLQRWHDNFADNQLGKGSRKLMELMETSALLPNGEATGYGLGLGIDEFLGQREVSHGGSFVGFRTSLSRYPEAGLGLAVLCNRADANPEDRAREVAALYLAGSVPADHGSAPEVENSAAGQDGISLAAAQLERHTGSYWNEEFARRRMIVLQEGALFYDRDGGRKSRLVPLAPDRFVMAGAGPAVEVIFAADTAIVMVPGEPDFVLQRYDPGMPDAAALAAMAGTYYSPELDHFQRLLLEDGQLLAERRLGNQALEPLPGGRFTTEGMILEFERDAGGTISGFKASSGRVQNLAYRRQ
jgi:CubicO group peptidase (beta-lactamase class C family)